jgi:hypothetical protein
MAPQRIRHVFRPSVERLERTETLLIDSKVMAEFLGVPNQTFEQLVYTDRIPFPMRFPFGNLMRWSVLELLEWVEAGCPRRKKWIEMRGSSGWYPAWRWR